MTSRLSRKTGRPESDPAKPQTPGRRFQHLITTTAKESHCGRCGAAILTATDEGLNARVDATPLRDRHAEIAALLDGRRTYKRALGGQLHYRDEYQLRKPDEPGQHIHAEHRCRPRSKQLTLDLGATR